MGSKAKHFTAANGRIYDPEGSDYVAVGANVNGNAMWGRPNGRESGSVRQDFDIIADIWKFNMVRVVCTFQFDHPDVWNRSWHYDDIGAIVAGFTAKKVVSVIEMHDYTGVYPLLVPGSVNKAGESRPLSLYEFTDAWVALALKHKDNPYAWFNIMNEPSHANDSMEWIPIWRKFFKELDGREYPGDAYDYQLDADVYLYVHDFVIGAMRKAGIENIIVLDENHYGQAAFDVNEPYSNKSACIYNAPKLNKSYDNLVYSLHPYGWADLGRMIAYAEAMKKLGVSWIFGEYGPVWGEMTTHMSAMNVLTISLMYKIGHMYWDWSNDSMPVVDRDLPDIIGGWGWEIDKKDGTKPTNLSWYGNLLWDYTRGELTLPIPRFVFPLLVNGDFKNGKLNPWNNIGSNAIAIASGQSNDGSDCALLKPGKNYTGQSLDPTNFKPGKKYIFSAWGKTEGETPGECQIGFGVTSKGADKEESVVLNFSSPEWTRMEAELTVQCDVTSARIFVWRPDEASGAGFYFDKVALEEA